MKLSWQNMKTLFCEVFTDNWILLVTSPGNWEVSAASYYIAVFPSDTDRPPPAPAPAQAVTELEN